MRRTRESIEGFSDEDVVAYVNNFFETHNSLPKLVAYKTIASELNTDFGVNITAGDVKSIYDGSGGGTIGASSAEYTPAPIDSDDDLSAGTTIDDFSDDIDEFDKDYDFDSDIDPDFDSDEDWEEGENDFDSDGFEDDDDFGDDGFDSYSKPLYSEAKVNRRRRF
jgi:hypothetical protein